MEPASDEELIAAYRARCGTPEADSLLEQVFQRYHSKVGLWCWRLTGDRESAADLAQEVFLKAFRFLDSFRGDAKFSTWLYSIARNHCLNEIKSRASQPEDAGEVLDQLVDAAADHGSQLERESSAAALRQLMQETLSEVESRVMTLHYGEELPLDAITRLLKLENQSGAKAYIVSAKRKLARAIPRWKSRVPGTA